MSSDVERATAEVALFLQTATPDMSHFLPNFISFGCKNEEFLLEANTWEDDDLLAFLKLVSNSGKSKLSGMDILVIKKHLHRSFGPP